MSESRSPADDASPDVIGARMRQFRTEQGLTLRGLAARSGLSIGFLSQVERGISSIGLTALGSVAAALGRSVAEFFVDDHPDPATAAGPAGPGNGNGGGGGAVPPAPTAPAEEDLPVHFTLTRGQEETAGTHFVSGQQTYRMLSDRGRHLVLEPMLVRIAPGGRKEEAYGHPGEEFAYVVEGELLYEVQGVEHRLYPGDSLHLRSNVPHRLYNDTDRVTTVISVVTPRLY